MALWHELHEEFTASGASDNESLLSPMAQHLHDHGVTICNRVTVMDGYKLKFSSRQPVAVAVKLGIKYIREHLGGEPEEIETLFYEDRGEFTIYCI